MKNPLLYFVVLLLCGAFWQCSDEPVSVEPDTVSVTFSVGGPVDSGGRTAGVPAALYVSVVTDTGVPVFMLKKLTILAVDGGYVTESLELKPAFYKITDFVLADDSAHFLYAVPKKGSPLEKAVSRPLPYRFQVAKNDVNNVAMQVIDVSHSAPADLGYASFSIEVVNPLRVSVFTRDEGQLELASADAYLLQGSDTVEHFPLGAVVNLVSFEGSALAPYTLVVAKAGYNPYVLDFTYEALADSLTGLSLQVYLYPALTILAYTEGWMNSFTFSMETTEPATFYVLWGDGTNDTYTSTGSEDYFTVELSHTYASYGNFPVTVTGALDKVKHFKTYYDYAWYESVNLSGLQNLTSVSIGWMGHGPTIVDLRYNPKLETADLSYNIRLAEVRLAVDNHITGLDVSGPSQLNTADVDDIVSKIYNAVVQGGYSGSLGLQATFTSETDMVGPPSPEAMAKLHVLWETYHWYIRPLAVFPPPGS